jgi:hypothetical protein
MNLIFQARDIANSSHSISILDREIESELRKLAADGLELQ